MGYNVDVQNEYGYEMDFIYVVFVRGGHGGGTGAFRRTGK